MFHLPNNIIELIYSYDSTFHNKYDQVKKEFSQVNNFWGIQFHNQAITERMSSQKMKATYSNSVELSKYWNNEFLKSTYISIDNYNNWYTKNGVCSPVHHSDIYSWRKIWPIFKANLASYRFLSRKNLVN